MKVLLSVNESCEHFAVKHVDDLLFLFFFFLFSLSFSFLSFSPSHLFATEWKLKKFPQFYKVQIHIFPNFPESISLSSR